VIGSLRTIPSRTELAEHLVALHARGELFKAYDPDRCVVVGTRAAGIEFESATAVVIECTITRCDPQGRTEEASADLLASPHWKPGGQRSGTGIERTCDPRAGARAP
jgi:hypothetical protein